MKILARKSEIGILLTCVVGGYFTDFDETREIC
jgi:hypothetical protein